MNVKDIDSRRVDLPENGDMLANIFARQKLLMEKYREIEVGNGIDIPKYPVDLQSHRGTDHIKRVMLWCIEEMMEAANTLKQKPWKSTPVESDTEHYLEEIADAFHFFVELCINSGLEPGDLYLLYFKKSGVNKFRQDSNY